jgi:hypothetical protein
MPSVVLLRARDGDTVCTCPCPPDPRSRPQNLEIPATSRSLKEHVRFCFPACNTFEQFIRPRQAWAKMRRFLLTPVEARTSSTSNSASGSLSSQVSYGKLFERLDLDGDGLLTKVCNTAKPRIRGAAAGWMHRFALNKPRTSIYALSPPYPPFSNTAGRVPPGSAHRAPAPLPGRADSGHLAHRRACRASAPCFPPISFVHCPGLLARALCLLSPILAVVLAVVVLARNARFPAPVRGVLLFAGGAPHPRVP